MIFNDCVSFGFNLSLFEATADIACHISLIGTCVVVCGSRPCGLEFRMTDVKFNVQRDFALNCSKILELEEELKVVGNNMKSLEISEQEVS